jgi:hypothetical protein
MSNGTILEGCIVEMNNIHLKLVEQNNNIVIVKIEDISLARIVPGSVDLKEEKQMYPATISELDQETKSIESSSVRLAAVVSKRPSEFSVGMSNNPENPTFDRETTRSKR